MSINLTGKTALVTWAAQGLGLGIAKELAIAGANIVIGDINNTAQAVAAIRTIGVEVKGYTLDVTKSCSNVDGGVVMN